VGALQSRVTTDEGRGIDVGCSHWGDVTAKCRKLRPPLILAVHPKPVIV